MILTYRVEDDKYKTIKEVVKRHFDVSQRLLTKLKLYKKILLNGECFYINKEIQLGDKIEIDINFAENVTNVVPTKMSLDIIYEDEALLIINKPANMATHPSNLHYSTSLSNGVKYYYNLKGIKSKMHLVNRLDKDTSGIVIFAKK